MDSKLQHGELTEQIIGAAFEVHRELGHGFLESVYQKAMQVELLRRQIACEIEAPVKVKYKGAVVGDFRADLLVEGTVLVELKVSKEMNAADEPQLLNELKATGIKLGMLINFWIRQSRISAPNLLNDKNPKNLATR